MVSSSGMFVEIYLGGTDVRSFGWAPTLEIWNRKQHLGPFLISSLYMCLSSNAVYAGKRIRIGIDFLYSGSSLDKLQKELQIHMLEES